MFFNKNIYIFGDFWYRKMSKLRCLLNFMRSLIPQLFGQLILHS